MSPLRKFRARTSWKPRTRFAPKAKPRFRRGPTRKAGTNLCSSKPISPAAGQHTSGRRVNRLPEWTDKRSYITKGERHRLKGADYERLRYAAYVRARDDGSPTAFCECGCERFAPWGEHMGLAAKGELSHNEHGSRKSDELSRVKWMRHECHMKSHNCGGKPIKVTKKSLKEKACA